MDEFIDVNGVEHSSDSVLRFVCGDLQWSFQTWIYKDSAQDSLNGHIITTIWNKHLHQTLILLNQVLSSHSLSTATLHYACPLSNKYYFICFQLCADHIHLLCSFFFTVFVGISIKKNLKQTVSWGTNTYVFVVCITQTKEAPKLAYRSKLWLVWTSLKIRRNKL